MLSVEATPEQQAQPARCALAAGSAVDLSQYSDLFVLRVIGEERPEFVDILAGQIDRGRTDAEIIRIVCEAGGSPQAMRYASKLLRALRNLPNIPQSGTGEARSL